jgi:uroporphyrinogen decarboxylase
VSARPNLLRVLAGEALSPPPIWIMRQAGRYLPEYQQARRQAGSFLDLCFTPELAAEVTLQPVRRFDFDAAILFSDILLLPHALGQEVVFTEGQGPSLAPFVDLKRLDREGAAERLAPVLETVRRVRKDLPNEKALIGFCGAPWTVATYMVAGRGTADQLPARRMALEHPDRFQALIDVLVDVSVDFLIEQARVGADVLKIFDTWAGILDEDGFGRWAIAPVKAIVARVKEAVPQVPIIAFPKSAGTQLGVYAQETRVDGVAVDWTMPMSSARKAVPSRVALQGNLDPLRLAVGGAAMDDAVDAILGAMRGRAHIFNLGHGIMPDTPVENVARLVERVRGRR